MVTLLGTVVYEQNYFYVEKYFNALNNLKKEFNLLLIFEGQKSYNQASRFLDNIYFKKHISIIKNKLSHAKLRETLIDEAEKINNWEKLIFIDYDDEISHNAIELHLEALEGFDISVGNLRIIDSDSKYLGHLFFDNLNLKKNTVMSKDIIFKNIFGMTNTAIKRKVLNKRPILNNTDIRAYDWWLFTSFLDQGLKAKVIYEPVGSYRVKEKNTLGWGSEYNMKRFKKEIFIINTHFREFKPNKYRKIAMELVLEAKGLIIKLDNFDRLQLTNNNVWYYDFFRNVLRLRNG